MDDSRKSGGAFIAMVFALAAERLGRRIAGTGTPPVKWSGPNTSGWRQPTHKARKTEAKKKRKREMARDSRRINRGR